MSAMRPISTKNGEPVKRRRANRNNFSNRFPQIVAASDIATGALVARPPTLDDDATASIS